MSPATLAIQVEAWLQQELAGQEALHAALTAIEAAVRAGRGAEVEARARELERVLADSRGVEARRAPLVARIAEALGVPARAVRLADLVARLAADGIETARLAAVRARLRETASAVRDLARRLAAQAHYHRGLLEELCRLLTDDPAGAPGRLVDARA